MTRVRRLPAADRPDRGDRRPAADRVQAADARPGGCSRCATRSCSSSARRARSGGATRASTRRAARARATAAGLTTVCRLPATRTRERLRDLADPPAVLHVLGDPAALDDEDGDRRRRRPARVVVRARGRPGARPRPVGGAACRSSPGSRSASTRRPTPARSRRPGARSACSRRSAHVAYPARGWRLHAAVAAARGGDLRAAARRRGATAGASSPATASSPRSAPRPSSCRPPSAPAR